MSFPDHPGGGESGEKGAFDPCAGESLPRHHHSGLHLDRSDIEWIRRHGVAPPVTVRVDHPAGQPRFDLRHDGRQPFVGSLLEVPAGKRRGRVDCDGRRSRHTFVLIVGDPGDRSRIEGEMTVWKLGWAIEGQHCRQAWVVPDVGEFGCGPADRIEHGEGLRDGRREDGHVGPKAGVGDHLPLPGVDADATYLVPQANVQTVCEMLRNRSHGGRSHMPRLDATVGVGHALTVEPHLRNAGLHEATDELSELGGTGAEVLSAMVEAGVADAFRRHPSSDGPSLVDHTQCVAFCCERSPGREAGHPCANDQNSHRSILARRTAGYPRRMELFEALYTTRAMRRVKPDPIPDEVQAAILDAAVRAPSGGNSQNWRFLIVTDQEVRGRLAPLYRQAFEKLQTTIYAGRREAAEAAGDVAALRVMRSSAWLAENFEQVPMWFLAFSRNDPTGASIYPAVWNAMLAARGHEVGTCLTTILGVFETPAVFEALGVPEDKGWVLSAAVSCGYPLGKWGLAKRAPADQVGFADRWGQPLPFEVDQPLWTG